MSLREWTRRCLSIVRPDRHDHDLEAELRAHLELAEEDAHRRGLTGAAATRAARIKTGGLTQAMDAVRDQQRLPWLDALTADVVFGWRQLRKHRVATVAAVFSLGLAIGATTAAFRLVDAVLLRSLPVSDPERLFALAFNAVTSQGEIEYRDEFDYPTFQRYRDAAGDRAQLMVIGFSSPQTIVIGDDAERAYRQYVSGNTFGAFGLQPALGRLLGPTDDVTPGGHPVAVISYDYWTRRFGQSPTVIGQTFRWGRSRFDIIGVTPKGFTGTEPGRVTDFFAPAVMNSDALTMPGYSWFRLWVRPAVGVTAAQVQQRLQQVFADDRAARAKSFPATTPQAVIDAFLREQIQLTPAGSGASTMQRNLTRPLWILGALVVLVLAIAGGNVANVLGARSVARAREMALRVSIGAGRGRLIQLVLVESALLAMLASCVGALFAWWASPFVVSLLELDAPVRLVLDVDWRVLGFGTALTMLVAGTVGLAPARRASAVDPLRTMKGSDDPHAHRRLTRALVGAQMAFCVFVLFSAGLFVATFDRLSNQPLGFSPDRLVVLEAEAGTPQDRDQWIELTERVRTMPGVESAALAGWAPLTGNRWTSPVRVSGGVFSDRPPYFIDVSPRYFATMHLPLIQGRDFQRADVAAMTTLGGDRRHGVAIVNATFAREFFGADTPVGKQLLLANPHGVETPMDVVGVVGDAVYRSVRDPVPPTVYVPITVKRNGALLLRTSADPLPLLAGLRRDVSRVSPTFRVSNVATQNELVRRQMVLERLIALLSSFFATVAVLLSAVGLYGVLNYAVTTQHRELGIRMALGARASQIVGRVTGTVLTPIGIGLMVGLAMGMAFGRLIERLLFQIKPTDAISFTIPLVILAVAAIVASVPPAIRALRIDPAQILRSE